MVDRNKLLVQSLSFVSLTVQSEMRRLCLVVDRAASHGRDAFASVAYVLGYELPQCSNALHYRALHTPLS
ncbi:hypothetical protein, partial [Burkholderia thailandensis]|uniref:hypothetical protein n=1 Tax=Burkholderia thailandensis TaxID=57975 RepID=UPI00217EB805